jgi:hypothetical protein
MNRRRRRLAPYAVYAVAVLYFVTKSPYVFSDFPLDDAWIHRVYASAFAAGRGFQYNAGGGQEAGSTSPLWAIVSAPAHWLEPLGPGAVVAGVKAIEVVLGGLLLDAIQSIGADVMDVPLGGAIAATLFALDPRFLFSALSGMENVLLVALWVWGARDFAVRRYRRSLLWFSLAPVTRPEAAILLPLWLIGRWLLDRSRRPTLVEHGAWLLAWTPALLWGLFCRMVANGHWLPTTFYLKSRPFQLGWTELRVTTDIIAQHGYAALPLFGVGIALLVVWTCFEMRSAAAALLWYLVLAPLAYAGAVAGSRDLNPSGYYWTRWLDPAALSLTVAFCLACGTAMVEMLRVGQALRRRSPIAASQWCLAGAGAALTVGLALQTPSFAASFAERRDRLASDARAINLVDVRTGEWIHDHTPADARVGVHDAGAIRYFGQRRTLDLVGLNDARVAFGQRPIGADEVDWLAVFPSLLHRPPHGFMSRQVVEIPLAEYTVCPCAGQNRIEIFERTERSAG